MMISLLFSLFAYGVFGGNDTCNWFTTTGYTVGPTGPDDCFYSLEASVDGEDTMMSMMGTCNDDGSLTISTYDESSSCSGTASSTDEYSSSGSFTVFECSGSSSCENDDGQKFECKDGSDKLEQKISFSTEACIEWPYFGYYNYKCTGNGNIGIGGFYDDAMCSDAMTFSTETPETSTTSSTTTETPTTTESEYCELKCFGDGASELMKVYILAFAVVVSLFY